MTGKFSTPHFVIRSSIKLPIVMAAEIETCRQYEVTDDSGVLMASGLEGAAAVAAAACLVRMRITQLCIALETKVSMFVGSAPRRTGKRKSPQTGDTY